ncbi:hypothetical protein QBC37DRAFT_391990 [Rhypophila decipiens]|uniref:Uncharacterized protein n=1 Tax=Rhypophila decipiens TaxID=261697 RepID=A0AAN6XZL1_9PEZI|nr:hypothetical protein QBC37DRAFT_391990 [Rhypophila decipiens]
MPASEIDNQSNSSGELSRGQSPVPNTDGSSSASSPPEERKQPWRDLPEFKSAEDNVHVSKVRDMRLFGNHVNAHS